MDFNLDNMNFSDIIQVDSLNPTLIHNIFGLNLDWDWITSIRFDVNTHNHWVWGPISLRTSVAATVYDCLVSSDPSPWPGWNYIWKLCVLPRIKTFIWKLAHGKLPTSDYLYSLNIGPPTQCHFCGLVSESASHIIWNCYKIVPCWNSLCASFNLDFIILTGFSTSNWLTSRFTSKISDAFFKALIASIAWIIWKDRCNLIFKNWQPKYHTIYSRAWNYCRDFFKSIGKDIREFPYPSLTSSPWSSINLFTDASWSDSSVSCGLGFIAITNTGQILLAGSMKSNTDLPISAEIDAIHFALDQCISKNWSYNRILCDCPGISGLLKHFDSCVA
ncbi:uncharacterized protein LOC120259982 [Dioscorea cayenensis subsp. rotundata]|uniref:Uncharacterized protein LOC120259982 n=1 Tax=Dioscorea cayennensis subsp. rotundata TaxID=55577 RepID=A0AB40B870_DIOCR|nr:uncharacterized protein LOC120259982 [Dioscorea cayenensis subsp. rotundata]